ncbi:MAG: diguanylate cyclase [Pseudomonadota bacterium]
MTEWQAHGESDPGIDPDIRLQQIRDTFVDDVLRGLVWLALCILAVSFWRNFLGPSSLRWPAAFAMVAVSTASLCTLFVRRKHLSYRFKATGLLCVLFLTATGGLVSFGQAAPTGNFFAMGFFVSAVLFARHTVFMLIGGTALVIACAAFAALSGLHTVPINLNAVAMQPVVWVNLMLTLALSAGAIATAMGSFMRAMQSLLEDVHRQQTEIKAQRDQIRHLATHDNLTGLPIMRLAVDRSHQAMAHARHSGQKIAFMFLDLDGFKEVNDRHGHEAGDRVLQTVAERLKSAVRSADTAARIGGDEFVVILSDLSHAHFAGDVAEKILRAIGAPIAYDGHALSVGASIGIAIFPDHAEDLEGLKRVADRAMYAVKTSGKNRYQFAQPSALPIKLQA